MMDDKFKHYAMNIALDEALKAQSMNEIPIGAVITSQNQIIAKAHNLVETLQDPTAHAEMIAITAATNHIGAKYLKNCQLFVTLEPCPMCAMALKWTQIDYVCWATSDPKQGFQTISNKLLHKKTIVQNGVCEKQAKLILTDFFLKMRK